MQISGCNRLEDTRVEADGAAAFINREIDGDVSSSAAGSGGKKKRERLGWLPDAAYRWRATCWYSRSIAHTVSKIITCDIIRRSHSIVMTDIDGLTGVWDVVKMRGCLWIIFFSFSKVLPIMCAHRSRAHLAPDSFSNDAHSRGRLATSTTTRSFPIPALVSHLGNG